MSGGSSLSLESSPTTSPYQHNRRKIITSSSMAELVAQGDEDHLSKYTNSAMAPAYMLEDAQVFASIPG